MVVRIYRLYKIPRLAIKELTVEASITAERRVLSADELVDIILEKFRLKPRCLWRWLVNNCKIYVADPWYHVVTREDIEELKKMCCEYLGDKKYQHPIFDCDDYSNVCQGLVSMLRYRKRLNLAIGKVWIYIPRLRVGHATMFYIDENLNFRWFEPQICREYNFDIYDPIPILIEV